MKHSMKITNLKTRNSKFIAFTMLLAANFTDVHAQQWLGSGSSTGNIQREGNVGIGTPSFPITPSFPMHIYTSTSPWGNYGLIHTDGTVEVGTWVGTAGGIDAGWFGTKSNHALHFFTNDGGPQLTIKNGTGYVGVNEQNPIARFTVKDNLMGVYSQASAAGGDAVGGRFIADGGTSNEAVEGRAKGGDFSTGGEFTADDAKNNTGVEGRAQGGDVSSGGGFNGSNASRTYGVGGGAFGNCKENSTATGGQFSALDAESNVGVEAMANGTDCNKFNYGVNAVADQQKGIANYGVRSSASTHGDAYENAGFYTIASTPAKSGCNNYGIYAMIVGGKTQASPANGSGSYAGYFWDATASSGASGAAFFNGVMVAAAPGVTAISDRKFKENINPLESTLDKIMQLSPVSYTFKDKGQFPSFTFPSGKQFGFIAQEMEEVFPELVHQSVNPAHYDDKGNKTMDAVNFKGVNYTELIPVIIAGIQEQQTAIAAKDAKIAELEDRIKKLESSGATGMGNGHSNTGATLYQNNPNPFDSYTEIRYLLPQTYTTARITVFDMNGKQLRDLPLQGTGEGKIQLSSAELAAGMYLYSLILDGKEVDTKRMILSGK